MDNLEAGGGAGAAALGPLAGMWRDVYRKAAAVAEGRAAALLEGHRLHLHQPLALVFTYDGAGAVPDVSGGPLRGPAAELPRPCEIVRWALHADQVGSATVDLWAALPDAEGALPTYPPTVAQSITAGTPPVLESQVWRRSVALEGWTVRFPQGAVLVPVLTAAAGVTLLTLTLRLRAL